jgi:putative colanic acid biosynthesis acetyltransferase WcaF
MIDVVANRRARKWTPRELLVRAAWGLAHPLFAWSPRPLWAWRRALLRLFGARVGVEVHVYPTVRIAIPSNLTIGDYSAIGDRAQIYDLGPITIGRRVTVSQNAHLCAGTHDHRDHAFPLLKPPIVIGDGAWICADAFVGPGVTIGCNSILGARSVAMRSIPDDVVAVGYPAKVIGPREPIASTDPSAR